MTDTRIPVPGERLPVCPTCDGTRHVTTYESPACPDCTDGYMPLAKALAVVRAVFAWTGPNPDLHDTIVTAVDEHGQNSGRATEDGFFAGWDAGAHSHNAALRSIVGASK
jgi:hypothetical protein